MPLSAIYPIVEGHGDVQAVPVLLRRFAHEIFGNYGVHIFRPHRIPRGRLLIPDYLEKAAGLGTRKLQEIGSDGAMLVLLDADTDCPAEVGPRLLKRVRAVTSASASVVLPKTEYEAWFLAAAVSLRGIGGIAATATPPSEPEAISGAKEHLVNALMDAESIYSPTVDQPALTATFDFTQARMCPSFDKLWRDLDTLFGC